MDYNEYISLYEATEADYANVRKLGTLITPAMDDFLEKEYEFLSNILSAQFNTYFPNDAVLRRAKDMSRIAWLQFFDAKHDKAYVQSRIRIAETHARLRILPKHYLAAMHKSLELWSYYAYTLSGEQNDLPRLIESLWRLGQIESAFVVNVYSTRTEEIIFQIKEQQNELGWLYNKAPFGFAVFDMTGRFIYINEYLAIIDQLTVEEHVGHKIHDILPIVSRRYDIAKDAIIESNKPLLDQVNKINFPNEPERTRYFNENWYPLYNKEAQIVGIGALVEETTDKLSAAKLREQDKLKNQFLATLSHELRNPVATIALSIDIAKERLSSKEYNPDDLIPFIDRAGRQIKHLTRLLDDLLEVSRITQGKIEIKPVRVEITDVIFAAIELSNETVNSLDHELIVHWPESSLFVNGDTQRLVQVFSNIINNSAKYTPPKGKIVISIMPSDDFVSISIKDNGVGIKKENIDHIFEMFYQINTSSNHQAGGLGIGLALVQRLVILHGGLVNVLSDGEGLGTTFVVKLPLDGRAI